jgi:adenosylhomocysteine nucleosidase
MMSKILVVFAMKEEFVPWRRRHRFHRTLISQHPVYLTNWRTMEVCVALAGAGAVDISHLVELTAHFAPSMAIVTGVAAGLKPEWRPGDMLAAQSVSNPQGEEKILAEPKLIDLAVQCGAQIAPALITLPHVARTVDEKARLASFGEAADMESLSLMKQWSARGIPSLALRVILDPAEMPMPCDFEAAMDQHGQVRITQILAQLARKPQLLPDFLRLSRQSRRVLKILARFLDQFLERLDHQNAAATPL